jgi:hypothetical protein
MNGDLPTFDDYVASLTQLRTRIDPTAETDETRTIHEAAQSIEALDAVDSDTVGELIRNHPQWVPVLGLVVGLTQESLKNALKHHLGTSGWVVLARTSPGEVVAMLDREYDLLELMRVQRARTYRFGDVLVARAGTRGTAVGAGKTGQRVENEIEAVAAALDLPYQTRTRFLGRGGATAPCDLAIPSGGADAKIVVAAKGFDSTGSKLTDAVREIEEMANVRLPTQFTMAAVDGIGWKNRIADLRRIYDLCADGHIDGLYTLSSLDRFESDLSAAARRLGLA